MSTQSGTSRRLEEMVHPTVFVHPDTFSDCVGAEVVLALETFQRTGSFKFRAAYNVAWRVPQRRILTASSGNFGQAMACACKILKKHCTVVMPRTSAEVKIQAVRRYGADVDLIDTSVVSRADRVRQLASEMPDAYVASAYDDPLVIEGNATLGRELAAHHPSFDAVIVPIGGGGLASGILKGLRAAGCLAEVWAAEPLMANDAARSLRAGRILHNRQEPQTIADGARTVSVGRHNWPILRGGLAGIVEIPEQRIRDAVRMLFLLANTKSEPTGALSVAALLVEPPHFRGRRVCCVISGGNVDPRLYADLISE